MTAPVELDVAQAIHALTSGYAAPRLASTEVALGRAVNRVLAGDVVSALDLPAFDNAAMDGYAVRSADAGAGRRLRLQGRALAGHAFAGTLDAGACVRVTTGAPLPSGADAVVMQEDASLDGDMVVLSTAVTPGTHVRRRGEHVRAGDVVLRRGRVLTAEDIGLATAIGRTTVAVVAPLSVAVASTGDELRDPPAPLAASASYDANRPFLAALLAQAGYRVTDLGICADHADAFAATVERAGAAGADVLLTTGGAAQGDADVVRRAGVSFLPLNIRPGRGIAHAAFARGDRPLRLLGLPGNAVAAYVMYQLVAAPVLRAWSGADPTGAPMLYAPLAQPVTHRAGRIDWLRARRVAVNGVTCVEPLAQQGSAMLRSVVDADCLIGIGPQATYGAGDLVPVLPLPRG